MVESSKNKATQPTKDELDKAILLKKTKKLFVQFEPNVVIKEEVNLPGQQYRVLDVGPGVSNALRMLYSPDYKD